MTRSGDEGLEQRLDRWVEAGRQFVDGVSGARPGSRNAGRSVSRRSAPRLNPAEIGRWAQDRLEWLLDDDGPDDWREPWQPSERSARSDAARRPLEAISRRQLPAPQPQAPVSAGQAPGSEWPGDETFTVPRWQRRSDGRAPGSEPQSRASADQPTSRRPLPRSSRSRGR